MLPSMMTLSALAASASAAVGTNSSSMTSSSMAPSATGSTYQFPSGFNIGLVKPQELTSWCIGQRNQCPEVCDGNTSQNNCDPMTLQFSCICANGTVPDMSPYISTVPFYVCEATYGQCINAHPNDAMGQRECKQNAKCGTKNASAADTTLSSTKSGSHTLGMATSTGSSDSGSSGSKSTSESAAKTSKNAAAVDGVVGYSTGLFAGAMFLAMRLVL